MPDDGGVYIDPTGKSSGRGAYICGDPACWATAAKSSVLDKALRTELTSHDRKMIAEYDVQATAQQGQQDG